MPGIHNASPAGFSFERPSEVNETMRIAPGGKVESRDWPSRLVSLCNRSVRRRRIKLSAGSGYFRARAPNKSHHSLWVHFEAYNILSHPIYASRYPPGQRLVLALGMLLHAPWLAVWFSTALLCGLITWALWSWLKPQWAIAGGLLAALQLTGSYWTESYWDGSVAAIGGALAVGSLARLLCRASCGPAMLFGLGLVILANTRPFEGVVLGALAFAFLLFHCALCRVCDCTRFPGCYAFRREAACRGDLRHVHLHRRLRRPDAGHGVSIMSYLGHYHRHA